MEEKKYTGYGYHGGGRPRKDPKDIVQYVNLTVSGKPEEIAALKEHAAAIGKTVSRYIIETCLQK